MEWSWTPLKTFAQTRPVLYGAPTAAVLGVILGLAFRVGPQLEDSAGSEPFTRAAIEDTAAPIAWPSGQIPDYVVGTDFLAMIRHPAPIIVADYEPPPMPEPIRYEADERPAPVSADAAPAPARAERHWPSEQGDILSIVLPEDRPAEPTPVIMVAAAPRY